MKEWCLTESAGKKALLAMLVEKAPQLARQRQWPDEAICRPTQTRGFTPSPVEHLGTIVAAPDPVPPISSAKAGRSVSVLDQSKLGNGTSVVRETREDVRRGKRKLEVRRPSSGQAWV